MQAVQAVCVWYVCRGVHAVFVCVCGVFVGVVWVLCVCGWVGGGVQWCRVCVVCVCVWYVVCVCV